MSNAIASGHRVQFNEFMEVKSRLAKMDLWLEEATSLRENKTEPERRQQTKRLDQIEAQLLQVMQALSIKYEPPPEVQEAKPAPRRRRRRQPVAPSMATQVPETTADGVMEPTQPMAAASPPVAAPPAAAPPADVPPALAPPAPAASRAR